MVKTNIVSLINSRIIQELAELEAQKSHEIQTLHEDMARKGQINGTPCVLRVKGFCSEEIKEATALIRKTINEFIKTSGEKLSEELSAELKEKTKDKFADIGKYQNRHPKININAGPTLTSQFETAKSEIDNERSRSISKINTEIDLLMLASNSDNKEIPVFSDILPSSIKESKFQILESGDINKQEDINELIRLLFEEPECSFYLFTEKDKAETDSLLAAAMNKGDIVVDNTEFFHYKHPNHDRDYLKIEVRDGNYQWPWQKEVVEKGPMFVRREIKLSQRKRTELETRQKILMEDNLRKQQNKQANNNESKANDSSQVPKNPLQAFIHVIWPLNTIWKKVVLGIFFILVACFAVWSTLPDEIKKDIIHVFWNK